MIASSRPTGTRATTRDAGRRGERPPARRLACGFCHRASGTGGPENADIAGLPVAYFVQQVRDYKSGKRSTALPDRIPQAWMITWSRRRRTTTRSRRRPKIFAAIKPKKLVDVVETETVPRPTVAGWFFVDDGDEREPIGARIIESAGGRRPLRQPRRARALHRLCAAGSIAAGRALAEKPEIACAACHGEKLTGTDVVPGIAGRSPTYIFRQLYEYRHGFRTGPESGPMIEVVKDARRGEFLPLAAYLATLER